jgi:PadR family transcriptional regulator, regulatory protein PadR
MRRTKSLVKVALVMMLDPHGQYWGYDLTRQAGVLSGSLYPILRRMLEDGWLTDGWEDPATVSDRPPRRYYELTDKGRAALGATLAAARRERRFCELNWGFAG